MNKILIAVLIVIVLGGAVAYTRKSTNNSNASTSANTTSTAAKTNSTTSSTNAGQPAAGSIEIKNMIFTPPQISIKKGASVTWTNNDTVAHTVTDDLTDVGGPASSNIAPGATYTFTFEKSGSFQYHCTYHTSMRGTIVVE